MRLRTPPRSRVHWTGQVIEDNRPILLTLTQRVPPLHMASTQRTHETWYEIVDGVTVAVKKSSVAAGCPDLSLQNGAATNENGISSSSSTTQRVAATSTVVVSNNVTPLILPKEVNVMQPPKPQTCDS